METDDPNDANTNTNEDMDDADNLNDNNDDNESIADDRENDDNITVRQSGRQTVPVLEFNLRIETRNFQHREDIKSLTHGFLRHVFHTVPNA